MKDLFYIFLMLMISGCASKGNLSFEERDKAYRQFIVDENLTPSNEISSFNYAGWKSLSENFLIIRGNYSRFYLVETKRRCFGLSMARGIKINRFSNLTIRKDQDSISTTEDPSRKCVIKTIYPVDEVQSGALSVIGHRPRAE